MARSIEEQVEDIAKEQLKEYKVKYYAKTESINSEIDEALKKSASKSGGKGGNYPDIRAMLTMPDNKTIPVMIEVKGTRGKLIKTDDKGEIANFTEKGEANYSNIKNYAVNGAVHYAESVINFTETYSDVIAIGVNGYEDSSKKIKTEMGVYFVSSDKFLIPKKIADYSDLSFLKQENLEKLQKAIEEIFITEEEKEQRSRDFENQIETTLQKLNQNMHDNLNIRAENRVQLVCGMIMAALGAEGIAPLEIADLKGNTDEKSNDGQTMLTQISAFLGKKELPNEKIESMNALFAQILRDKNYYTPINDESPIKTIYIVIKDDIMPIFKSAKHLDFTGRLFNVLNSWINIRPGDDKNDVVLTPRYVTELMARLCQVNMDSYVWDYAAGSGGFLISAMKLMIDDATEKIKSEEELKRKQNHIKLYQILGLEIRPDIYTLAVLNMILMGDGSSHILNKDSLKNYEGKYELSISDEKDKDFPADVFLLNPPYSADGKGFVFVEKALSKMKNGYAAILIQENAGSGQGLPYTKNLLENNTLLASIKMPDKLFIGKSSVQTAIYLFEVGRPHDADKLVKFIDFTEDGYSRQNRKKSGLDVNLRDTDHAKERYAELCDIVLGRKKKSHYFDDCVIEDTIQTDGNERGKDWTYGQHKKTDTTPTEADFKKTVADYLSWKIATLLKEETRDFREALD